MTEKRAKELAERTAKRLTKKLGGSWKTRVWENFGWNCSVILGSISVHVSEYAIPEDCLRYSAFVSSEKNSPGGALAMWSDDSNYGVKSPETAVKNAMQYARECVLELTDNLSNNFDMMPLLREKMKKNL